MLYFDCCISHLLLFISLTYVLASPAHLYIQLMQVASPKA